LQLLLSKLAILGALTRTMMDKIQFGWQDNKHATFMWCWSSM